MTGDNPTCDYIFTGRRYDPESEIYFYRARYYVPELGNFVNKDPLGFSAGDANWYRYVATNPIIYLDPDGLQLTRIARFMARATARLESVKKCDACCEVRMYASSAFGSHLYHVCLEVETLDGEECTTFAIELVSARRRDEMLGDAKIPERHRYGTGPFILFRTFARPMTNEQRELLAEEFGGEPESAWGIWVVPGYSCDRGGTKHLLDAARIVAGKAEDPRRPTRNQCQLAQCIKQTAMLIGNVAGAAATKYAPFRRNSNSFIGQAISLCNGQIPPEFSEILGVDTPLIPFVGKKPLLPHTLAFANEFAPGGKVRAAMNERGIKPIDVE